MNLFKIFDISGSGMAAQTVRLNTTASNLANSDSVAGTPEGAYRARQPVFESVLLGQGGGHGVGVRVLGVVESQVPAIRSYEPGHPQADAEGYVFRSNVNLPEEMVNMMSAARSYQNNVEVLTTTRDLLLRTLSLGN